MSKLVKRLQNKTGQGSIALMREAAVRIEDLEERENELNLALKLADTRIEELEKAALDHITQFGELQTALEKIEELRKVNQHLWNWIPLKLKKQYTDDYLPYAKIIKGMGEK